MVEGKDVFISYHRATMAETLRQIAEELKNRGISFWYDTESPKPGHFTETIEEEIKACDVFLFIWDDGANNSTWCRDEVLSALAHEKHIFLFRVGHFQTENAELNFRLRAFQRFDVDNPPDQRRIQNLTETIADTLRGSRPTWKMIYEREQQLKKLESRLKQEQASAKNLAKVKEQRIAELKEELQQADSQIQAFKNRQGQKHTQVQELGDLLSKALLLQAELTQDQELKPTLKAEHKPEQKSETVKNAKTQKRKESSGCLFAFIIMLLALLGLLSLGLILWSVLKYLVTGKILLQWNP